MLSHYRSALLFLFVCPLFLFSQKNQEILFKSTGSLKYDSNIHAFIQEKEQFDLIENSYYRIIQFSKTPTSEEQSLLQSTGLKILEYIPENAYLVSIPKGFQKVNLLNTSASVPCSGRRQSNGSGNFHGKFKGKII